MLWHRSTLAMRRALARSGDMTRRVFNQRVWVSFAKVAEYRRRGRSWRCSPPSVMPPAGPLLSVEVLLPADRHKLEDAYPIT